MFTSEYLVKTIYFSLNSPLATKSRKKRVGDDVYVLDSKHIPPTWHFRVLESVVVCNLAKAISLDFISLFPFRTFCPFLIESRESHIGSMGGTTTSTKLISTT